MSAQNRIDPIAIAVSVPRQTPHNEFGSVLADTMGGAVSNGAALVGGVVGMNPISTAAVSTVRAAALTSVSTGTGAAPIVPSPVSGGVPIDSNTPDASLLSQLATSDPSSAAYLQLQMKMQQEAQQFSAASNVLKVRSDSAKAAINNIR